MRALALLPVALLAACSDTEHQGLPGYAEGEYVRVAAPLAGNLAELKVKRGMQVQADDPLFVLEHENEAAARREAADRLVQAEAQLANLLTGKRPQEIDVIRKQLAQAEAAFKLAEDELRRTQKLVADKFVSQAKLDEVTTARDQSRARVEEMRAQIASARLAARPDEIRAAEADVNAARAALAQAQWKLEQKALRAPQAALVADTLYVQGEWVPAGSPVVSLLPPQNIKLRFFVPERELGALRIGQQVTVTCDGCAAPIGAAISYISPQAEYTPPVIYSRENRAKLVFLIEARPAPADATKLHPGQPVEVSVR